MKLAWQRVFDAMRGGGAAEYSTADIAERLGISEAGARRVLADMGRAGEIRANKTFDDRGVKNMWSIAEPAVPTSPKSTSNVALAEELLEIERAVAEARARRAEIVRLLQEG